MGSDPELMERYCAGDKRAFYELYDKLAPALLRYLQNLTRDRARAEDLLQTTFLKLHQNRSAYVSGAAPKPWLFAIAHRTFIDEYRRSRTSRKHADAIAAREERAHITGVRESDAPEPTYDPALAEQAMAALKHLPPKQREAVELTKLEGLSTEEAAQVAGTSRGAIKQRVHRGYETMRAAMTKEDER